MAAIAAVGRSPAHLLVHGLDEWQAVVCLGHHLLSWRRTDMRCLSVYTTDLTITVTLLNNPRQIYRNAGTRCRAEDRARHNDRKGSLQGGSVAITHAVLRFRQASHGRFFRLLGRRGLPKVLLITNLRGGRRRRRDCCRGILSMATSSVWAEMLLETFMLNAHLAILTFGPTKSRERLRLRQWSMRCINPWIQ